MVNVKKVLKVEEEEVEAELEAEIALKRIEQEELERVREILNILHTLQIEIETARKTARMRNIHGWSSIKEAGLSEKLMKQIQTLTHDEYYEKRFSDRLLEVARTFLLNLGLLRQAYAGDPREKGIDAIESGIVPKLGELNNLLNRKRDNVVWLANWANKLEVEKTQVDAFRADIPKALLYAYSVKRDIESAQKIIRELMPLEIKEEHILKKMEHPLFGK